MKRIMPFLLLTTVALFSACDILLDTAAWEAVLPEVPVHWRATFPDARARLIVVNTDGSRSAADAPLAAGRYPVRIRKAHNTLVLLYPVPGPGHEPLRPYGAVFPASGDPAARTLALTPAGGFAAERLARLAERGCDISNFNTNRLLDLLAEKGGDPWDFDPLLFETRLAAGEFSVYAVKKLESRPVSLAVPDGLWFSESPAAPVWEAAGGLLLIPEMAYGFHTLYRNGGAGRVCLSVAEREVIVFGP